LNSIRGKSLSKDVVATQHQAILKATRADHRRQGDWASWLGSLRVWEIMSTPPICIDPQSSVQSACSLMRERGIRRLLVVEDKKLVGIITLGDARGALPSEVTTLNRMELDYLSNQLKVERAMTREVITIAPDASILEAARLMIRHKISGIPIIAPPDQILGLVTETDIFRTMIGLLEKANDGEPSAKESQSDYDESESTNTRAVVASSVIRDGSHPRC
jgi:CBS domain-containing protein